MGSLNRVMLIGNLGRDAEMRYTQGGTAVSNFNIATTSTWKDREGEKKEDTQWHRIVLWGKTAEALQDYLVKGKQIYVEGRLQTRKWQDKDGNDKYSTEVVGERVVLLGGKGGDGSRRAPATEEQATTFDPAGSQEPNDDDIPFAFLLPFILPAIGLLSAALGVFHA